MKNILNNNLAKGKQFNISKIPFPISLRPSKSILEKSKFFKKNFVSNLAHKSNRCSYTQVLKDNIKDIVKIKKIS